MFVPKDNNKPPSSAKYEVYKIRWFIIFVQFSLNVTNYMVFITYAPVANYVDNYYPQNTADLMTVVFSAVSVPVGVLAMTVAPRLKLKLIITVAAVLNALGAGVRIFSNLESLESKTYRLTVLVTGQTVAALANPTTVFLTTKLPAVWFSPKQRPLATAILSLGNVLGALIINPLSTSIVHSDSDLYYLNWIVFLPTLAVLLLAFFGIRQSEPATPPSASANRPNFSFWYGLKLLIKNRTYLFLTFNIGAAIGLTNLIYTTTEQTQCSRGYPEWFSSLCICLMIACGIIGGPIGGTLVGKTKQFELVLKVCLTLALVAFILFTLSSLQPYLSPLVATASGLWGFFGLTYYAIALEISAEISFPVPETTSMGINGLSGQIQGILYITLFGLLKRPLSDKYANVQTCTVSGMTADQTQSVAYDTTLSSMVILCGGTVLTILMVVFFAPKFKRLSMEEESNKTSSNTKSSDMKGNVEILKF